MRPSTFYSPSPTLSTPLCPRKRGELRSKFCFLIIIEANNSLSFYSWSGPVVSTWREETGTQLCNFPKVISRAFQCGCYWSPGSLPQSVWVPGSFHLGKLPSPSQLKEHVREEGKAYMENVWVRPGSHVYVPLDKAQLCGPSNWKRFREFGNVSNCIAGRLGNQFLKQPVCRNLIIYSPFFWRFR